MLNLLLLCSWLTTVSAGALRGRDDIPSPAPLSALLPAPVYSGKPAP